MGYENILVAVEAPIAIITLNRPKVLNALSPDLIREVNEALGEIDADASVRARPHRRRPRFCCRS